MARAMSEPRLGGAIIPAKKPPDMPTAVKSALGEGDYRRREPDF